MQFREKIETAASPLIVELRQRLASLPTVAVLNHYHMQHHLSQFGTTQLPDGFWAKWRYLWALLLSGDFSEAGPAMPNEAKFAPVNELTEKIFDLYSFGAVYEAGRSPGSEKEFLTRLGLGMRVREPDALGFPGQIKSWALARFRPFNDSYFLQVFGLRFEEIFRWIDNLIRTTEARLNDWVEDMVTIARDIESLRSGFIDGTLDIEEARRKSGQLGIGERLEINGRTGDAVHFLVADEMQQGISTNSFDKLIERFGIRPGEVEAEFVFPHHENPLEYKIFVVLPNGSYYFLDPASAHRVLAKTFERSILDDKRLRERYLLNRSRTMEGLVTESARKVFPDAEIYPNYYLKKGSHEKDLFIRDGNTVILIECKNSRVRAFRGATDDLVKFETDFENSVQYGYEQANDVKRRILENNETTFLDAKGLPYFSVKKKEVERIYIVCVTVTPRGPFGTDLSYELKKDNGEPFPLALGLFDFQTICEHLDSRQFIQYLEAREKLHGRVRTGDELNYAGYFLKYGKLNLESGTFVADDFSGIFDRKWYREQGMEVEEPAGGPVTTSMTRKGNRVKVEYSTGQKESIRLPQWAIERTVGKSPIKMKGSDRNQPCPCESGLKLKNCCGVG